MHIYIYKHKHPLKPSPIHTHSYGQHDDTLRPRGVQSVPSCHQLIKNIAMIRIGMRPKRGKKRMRIRGEGGGRGFRSMTSRTNECSLWQSDNIFQIYKK